MPWVEGSGHLPRHRARRRACAECNALAPARLRVTDEQVRTFSEARYAANQREQEISRARENKSTTRHLRADFEETYPIDQNTLCGHPVGRSPKGKRQHVYVWRGEAATCEKCIELAALTPEQRADLAAYEAAQKKMKLDTLHTKKDAERETARSARLAVIEAARLDAMVCLDAIEAGRDIDDLTSMFERALTAAIDAHVMAGGNVGKRRLWLTDGIPNECNCIARRSDGTHRDKCATRKIPRRANLVCRFCREVLAANVPMGSAFVNDSGRAHAQRCALEYLLPTNDPRHKDHTCLPSATDSTGLNEGNPADVREELVGTTNA